MALTDTQKSDLLFKKVAADKSTSSVITAFFEESVNSRKSVFVNDIWTQADEIPTTAPAATAGIVQKIIDLVLSHIAGANSLAFTHSTLKDIIPFTFGDGSYIYRLKKNDGSDIPFGLNDWYFDTEAGVLIFFNGFPPGVSEVLPPKISCFRYTGIRGLKKLNFVLSFNGISELADKYVDATTITSVTFDTGIATLQFSTDGTNFTNFTAPVSFVANTNVRWKVTFNTGFTLGAIEMKGYKN